MYSWMGFCFFSFLVVGLRSRQGEWCGEGGVCAWLGTMPRKHLTCEKKVLKQARFRDLYFSPAFDYFMCISYILLPTIETFTSDTWK